MKNILFILKINLLFAVLFLVSCDDNSLPKYVEINSLRILNIQVSDGSGNAEFNPGDVVTVTPFISDINNSGTLSYEAKACIDPGVAYGSEPSCESSNSMVTVGSGNISSVDVSSNYTGAANVLSVTLPATAVIFAGRSNQDKYNGVSYLLTYKLISSDGRSVKSFKRIVVSTKTTKNKNPVVNDILSNGAAITSLPLTLVSLSLQFGSGGGGSGSGVNASLESYSQLQSDGSYKTSNEELLTTWFISDGSLKYYRTVNADANEYTGPATAPAGRKGFIISVTRDGRGGSAVVKKEF